MRSRTKKAEPNGIWTWTKMQISYDGFIIIKLSSVLFYRVMINVSCYLFFIKIYHPVQVIAI